MTVVQRYAVSLPGPVGAHGQAEVVVVHWTPGLCEGLAVYENTTGEFRVVIDVTGVARLLGAGGGDQTRCLHAVALP